MRVLERERDLEAIVGVVVNEEVSVVVADLEFPSNHFLFLCVFVWNLIVFGQQEKGEGKESVFYFLFNLIYTLLLIAIIYTLLTI